MHVHTINVIKKFVFAYIPIKLLLFNIPVNNRFNSRFVQLGYIIASFKNF